MIEQIGANNVGVDRAAGTGGLAAAYGRDPMHLRRLSELYKDSAIESELLRFASTKAETYLAYAAHHRARETAPRGGTPGPR